MSQATTAIFLYIGLDNARQGSKDQNFPMLNPEEGFIGIVSLCDNFATEVEAWYAEHLHWEDEYPGCFDYEVTEHMGGWLYHQPLCKVEDFKAGLGRYVREWPSILPHAFTYEVNPTTNEGGEIAICEPSEADQWSVYERPTTGDEPRCAEWVADFLREADAREFRDLLEKTNAK